VEEGFQVFQIKGNVPLQGEIITKVQKYTEIKKKSSPEPGSQILSNLVQIILGRRGFKFVQIKGRVLFKGEIITIMSKWGWGL
jgi:hypothetical protein